MGGFTQAIKSPAVRDAAEELMESGVRKYLTSGESYLARFTGETLAKGKGLSGEWLAKEALPTYSKMLHSDTEALLQGRLKDIKLSPNPVAKMADAKFNEDEMRSAKIIAGDLSRTSVFGQKDARLKQAIENIGIESKSDVVKKNAADIVSIYLREQGFQKWRQEVGVKATSPFTSSSNFERLAKNILGYGYLSHIVIPHLGQPIYTLINNGTKAWLGAFAEVAHDPQSALNWTRRSGALFEESYRAMQDIAAGRDTLYHQMFHMPLFSKVRQWQIVHAAISGRILAEDMAEQFVRNGNKGAEANLRMLGLDPAKIQQQGGKLLAHDLEMASYRSADENFFIDQGLKSPTNWNRNSFTRGLSLYKNFSFRSGKMLKDSLMRSAKAGDIVGVTKKLAVLGTAFPTAGYMIQGISNLSNGRVWDDRRSILALTGNELTDDMINWYAHVGALGMSYSLFRAVAYNHTSDWVAGPAIGLATDVGISAKALITQGDIKPGLRRATARIPLVGGAISSNINNISDFASNTVNNLIP